MLRNQNLSDKTYTDRISEGIMQIPLYSSEWTNYNESDPGITILESLSLFETLQQNHINEMPVAVRAGLLKMLGFTPNKGRNARVLLYAENAKESFVMSKGQRFALEDIIFETRKDITINDCKVTSVYAKLGDDWLDYTHLLDREIKLLEKIFGDKPEGGSELYFFCNKLPKAGEEAIFYFDMEESTRRNLFEDRDYNMFASVNWEVYGEDGFTKINAIDRTGGFVTSGEIVLRLPQYEAKVFDERGYLIKATLEKAEYDIVPVMKSVYPFLFEAWQQHTEVITYVGKKGTSIETPAALAKDHYISVFAREAGSSDYRHYEISTGKDSDGKYPTGRYFEVKETEDILTYKFDKKRYGYGPERGNAAVRVIAYEPHIMSQYHIGRVEGYDDQIIDLPTNNIIADSFFIIARLLDDNGEKYYRFVRPGHDEENALNYRLYEREGYIMIKEAGDFLGAELFMGGCSTYLGAEGNIRAGNYLKAIGLPNDMKFYNPCDGAGGRFVESLEEVRKRFINDIDTPFSAVTDSDYEKIVLETPGLCIRKAKAYIDQKRNEVKVAVLPGNEGHTGLPELTEDYRRAIRARLEERRLLATKITLMEPQYEKVNVKATVYVDQYFDNNQNRIERRIKKAINYLESTKNFGSPLLFEEVFEAIEEDPGVEFVSKLKLTPTRSKFASVKEESIYPRQDVVLIPGAISVELIPFHNKK